MRNFINIVESAGRSKIGGQIGVNGFYYKGGRFLPATTAEPGKWKIGKKWIKSGQAQIGPKEWGWQPTPFSRSIFSLLGIGSSTRLNDDGSIVLNKQSNGDPILDYDYQPITLDTRIRPGVKGILSTEDFALGELIELYRNGARWVDVKPDAPTETTIG